MKRGLCGSGGPRQEDKEGKEGEEDSLKIRAVIASVYFGGRGLSGGGRSVMCVICGGEGEGEENSLPTQRLQHVSMTEGRVLEGFHITAGGGGEGRGVKDSSGYSNFFERRERGRQENPCLRLAMDEHISLLNIQSNSQISP